MLDGINDFKEIRPSTWLLFKGAGHKNETSLTLKRSLPNALAHTKETVHQDNKINSFNVVPIIQINLFFSVSKKSFF